MPKTTDQIQGLFGTTGQRLRLSREQEVEFHLDTGEVVEGTVSSLRSVGADKGRITAGFKEVVKVEGDSG
jgi:hypothetical protein